MLLFILSVRRVPPRFSIPPTNQEVMPGGSVNLTCVAVGSPMPYVKWMMGLVELTKEEEMPMGRNVLEVTNIRESVNYTCVAISSLGMIEATAQVTVKGERLLILSVSEWSGYKTEQITFKWPLKLLVYNHHWPCAVACVFCWYWEVKIKGCCCFLSLCQWALMLRSVFFCLHLYWNHSFL